MSRDLSTIAWEIIDDFILFAFFLDELVGIIWDCDRKFKEEKRCEFMGKTID